MPKAANNMKKLLQVKPETGITGFILIFSLINILLFNIPLYSYSLDNFDALTLANISALMTLTALNILLSSLLLFFAAIISRRLLKAISALIVVTNSAAIYFISTYQVFLTKDMIGNILNTNTEESTELFSFKLILFIVLLGVLPAIVIIRTRIRPLTRLKQLRDGGIIAAVCIGLIYSASGSWLWIDKHAKYLGALILPWSYVANTIRFQQEAAKANAVPEMLPDGTFSANKKTVVVLVIGETARSANFSLYGYERETNPQLKERDVIALANPTACSTYTTASVKCILSHDNQTSTFYEPLPTYLKRHGVDVIWRANNWGEPNINVTEYQKAGELRANCTRDDCNLDGVMLTGLKERIEQSDKDKVLVVLHQKGSHGPSYYTRYTPQFEQYTPVCQSVELDKCQNSEIVNAYDNTLLYTDQLLADIIDTLKEVQDSATLMMYLSDHGESLGEFGLYLHGAPYSLAPDVQKDIPFIIWPSERFIEEQGLDIEAIKAGESHSQSQVFHSILNAFDLESDAYNPELDIFNTAQ